MSFFRFSLRSARLLALAGAAALAMPVAHAQQIDEPALDPESEAGPAVTLDIGVDVQSRFIYRGINLGEAPQVQPRLSLYAGNFEVSLWSSHPLSPPADRNRDTPSLRGPNYREVLFWVLYNIDVGVGTLTPYIQNHYNPNAGDLFDFDGDGEGAHSFQAQLSFAGDERLPIDAMVGWVFHNDPDNSIYLEGGYRFAVSGLALRTFIGGVPAKSPFNGADEAAITNIGITARRTLPITETYSLPVGVSFIVNPYTENAFAVFSVSLL